MSISKKDVEHTAHLARIKLSQEDKERLTADLIKILEYVQKLQEINTASVDLDLAETHTVNQMREDKAMSSEIQDELLELSPKQKNNYFEVKGVFD